MMDGELMEDVTLCDNNPLYRNTLNYGTEEAQNVSKCVYMMVFYYSLLMVYFS